MSVTVPVLNPIRFYNPNTPDYNTYFPNVDNYTQRTMWIDGIYPVDWYKDFLINHEISFQLRINGLSDETIRLYKPDLTYDTLIPTNITPSGWISDVVNKYSFTPDEEGIYYLQFMEPGYLSDSFYVHSTTKYLKRIVKITYVNSENDFGIIFWDDEESKFVGETYFTGILKYNGMQNEISAFESDRGNLTILRSTPKRIATLELCDIHFTYIDNINMIFSCDTITVNGISYQTGETPSVEEISGSDLVNISIVLIQTNNDYFITNG